MDATLVLIIPKCSSITHMILYSVAAEPLSIVSIYKTIQSLVNQSLTFKMVANLTLTITSVHTYYMIVCVLVCELGKRK